MTNCCVCRLNITRLEWCNTTGWLSSNKRKVCFFLYCLNVALFEGKTLTIKIKLNWNIPEDPVHTAQWIQSVSVTKTDQFSRGKLFLTDTEHLNTLCLFCTMTNQYTIISQTISLLLVSTLSRHPQGACNQYLTKLHKYVKFQTVLPTAAFEIVV
jgi:hypothetical protein